MGPKAQSVPGLKTLPNAGPCGYTCAMTPLIVAALALAPAAVRARTQDPQTELLNQIAEAVMQIPDSSPDAAARRASLDKVEADAESARSAAQLARARAEFERWLGAPDEDASLAAAREASRRSLRVMQGYAQFASANGGEGPASRQPAAAAVPIPKAAFASAPTQAKAKSAEPPLPPPSRSAFSFDTLKSHLDCSWISDKVIESVEKIKNVVAGVGHLLQGFAGSCYYGAKWILIKTGVLPPEVQAPEQIGLIGIGSADAYMMDAALKRDPALQAKLHVRRLDLATVKDSDAKLIPPKTIFVFDRGCAGMSSEAGHIEVTLPREKIVDLKAAAFYSIDYRGPKYRPQLQDDQILNCSDGCALRTMAYLRTYGGERRRCLNAYVPVEDGARSSASL